MIALAHMGGADGDRAPRAWRASWYARRARLPHARGRMRRRRRTRVWHPRTGLPDDAFEHDGKLTKREFRALALAKLMPHPGALLWDIGAGCGSVGIEWMRAEPTTRARSRSSRAPTAAPWPRATPPRSACRRSTSATARAPEALAALPAAGRGLHRRRRCRERDDRRVDASAEARRPARRPCRDAGKRGAAARRLCAARRRAGPPRRSRAPSRSATSPAGGRRCRSRNGRGGSRERPALRHRRRARRPGADDAEGGAHPRARSPVIAYPAPDNGESSARAIAATFIPAGPDRDRHPRADARRARCRSRSTTAPRTRSPRISRPAATWRCSARAIRSSTAPSCICTTRLAERFPDDDRAGRHLAHRLRRGERAAAGPPRRRADGPAGDARRTRSWSAGSRDADAAAILKVGRHLAAAEGAARPPRARRLARSTSRTRRAPTSACCRSRSLPMRGALFLDDPRREGAAR